MFRIQDWARFTSLITSISNRAKEQKEKKKKKKKSLVLLQVGQVRRQVMFQCSPPGDSPVRALRPVRCYAVA